MLNEREIQTAICNHLVKMSSFNTLEDLRHNNGVIRGLLLTLTGIDHKSITALRCDQLLDFIGVKYAERDGIALT